MFSTKRYIISLALIVLTINLPAQNLTGTWEGDLRNDQFLQLNILQTGNKICGYTHDHIKANKKSFCKAFFEGSFDKQKKILTIDGMYFLQNSGDHVLMHLELDYKMKDGIEILEKLPPKEEEDPFSDFMDSIASKIFSFFNKQKNNPFLEVDSSDYVLLKKVSDQPYELIDLMKDCIGRDRKKTDTVVKKITPPKDSLPAVVKIITPEKPKDSVLPVVLAPVEIKKDTIALPKTLAQRKNKEQSRIEVDVKTINLKVYDNAIMDGDTVSILYNGKMLLTHQLLSEKGIELNIELDEKQTRHEITLFAENLGSIPPNTALIVITAGTKRYELFASASLEENAVLVFEYKPK
jgi:hypothetical protein